MKQGDFFIWTNLLCVSSFHCRYAGIYLYYLIFIVLGQSFTQHSRWITNKPLVFHMCAFVKESKMKNMPPITIHAATWWRAFEFFVVHCHLHANHNQTNPLCALHCVSSIMCVPPQCFLQYMQPNSLVCFTLCLCSVLYCIRYCMVLCFFSQPTKTPSAVYTVYTYSILPLIITKHWGWKWRETLSFTAKSAGYKTEHWLAFKSHTMLVNIHWVLEHVPAFKAEQSGALWQLSVGFLVLFTGTSSCKRHKIC